jgi:hypothetical protein
MNDMTEENYNKQSMDNTGHFRNSKFFNPSENMAIDEASVLFRGRVIFRQYIPKNHKYFVIKIYKTFTSTGYTGKPTWGKKDHAQHST